MYSQLSMVLYPSSMLFMPFTILLLALSDFTFTILLLALSDFTITIIRLYSEEGYQNEIQCCDIRINSAKVPMRLE